LKISHCAAAKIDMYGAESRSAELGWTPTRPCDVSTPDKLGTTKLRLRSASRQHLLIEIPIAENPQHALSFRIGSA